MVGSLFNERTVERLSKKTKLTKKLKELGVDFISLQDNIDTSTATGKLTFHILAALAEFESNMISERTKAGMMEAKRQGHGNDHADNGRRRAAPCCRIRSRNDRLQFCSSFKPEFGSPLTASNSILKFKCNK